MSHSIHAVAARDKLPPRPEPYWVKLDTGCHLGYRVNENSRTWNARFTHKGSVTPKRVSQSFGTLSEHLPKDQYSIAKGLAERWFMELKMGGARKPVTLGDACEAYITHVTAHKGVKAAYDIKRRFHQYVLDDPALANTTLQNLSISLLKQWREKLRSTPILSGAKKGKLRSSETLNRDMTCLRACLNFAFDEGYVASNMPWRKALRPVTKSQSDEVGLQREVYLSRAQRNLLIDEVRVLQPDLVPFLVGLCLVPIRPGALANLKVSDFDSDRGSLKISEDKANARRSILLPRETASFFKSNCKGKLPGAYIFHRHDGKAWNKNSWKRPVKMAVKIAGLPEKTVTYTFRHSAITDLVAANVPIMTVALLSGTSVRVIERSYAKLTADMSRQALSVLEG
jgi:integrase